MSVCGSGGSKGYLCLVIGLVSIYGLFSFCIFIQNGLLVQAANEVPSSFPSDPSHQKAPGRTSQEGLVKKGEG